MTSPIKSPVVCLSAGTKIRFLFDIIENADGDHPDLLWARKGEIGEIVESGMYWDYIVKVKYNEALGISLNEFEVVDKINGPEEGK